MLFLLQVAGPLWGSSGEYGVSTSQDTNVFSALEDLILHLFSASQKLLSLGISLVLPYSFYSPEIGQGSEKYFHKMFVIPGTLFFIQNPAPPKTNTSITAATCKVCLLHLSRPLVLVWDLPPLHWSPEISQDIGEGGTHFVLSPLSKKFYIGYCWMPTIHCFI